MIEACLRDGYAPYGSSGGRGSSVSEASRRLDISRRTLGGWVTGQAGLQKMGKPHVLPDWTIWDGANTRPTAPTKDPVRRYLFTAAQDETEVHAPFLRNLLAYAEHLGAQLHIGPFTYQKGLFTDHATRAGLFVEEVRPYLCYEHLDLGPIVFCGEMNILPTAVRPLSGLDSYTAGKWGVFPHAKVQLQSVATIATRHAIMLMTTGCCTVPNYIAKKAGLKAEFHHIIGATIVEIDSSDRAFCRQLNASEDGSFQDLDLKVHNGKVTARHRVEAITWGDIHREKIDPLVAVAAWGIDVTTDTVITRDAMVDTLRPRYQFFHDLLDFDARSHHRRNDHHHRFAMVCRGTDLVEDAVRSCARFLRLTERDWCRSVVVESNHDTALSKWLKAADYREDVANAEFFLRCQTAVYRAILLEDESFNIFRWAMAEADDAGLEGVDFVDENGSFVICQASGGIECGQHGHLGLNGARGSPLSFTKMATKMNTGHTHSASILDGVYTAGLSGLMDQGYNRGPGSWSHTHIVTYPSGKRSLVTMQASKWRA